MNFIIIFLIVSIFILITYLFLLKREIKKITSELKSIKKEDTNLTVHSNISSNELLLLINEINSLLINIRDKEILLERKNNNAKKMMTNISHDLRTPLTSAIGYIDIVLSEDLSNEEKKKNLNIIKNRLKKLEELINSFFEFSKIISSDKKIQTKSVNIVSVIEECIANYYDDYSRNNRKIILESNVSKLNVLSNKEMLTRIFDNLISNAYKHSDSDLIVKLINNDILEISFENDLVIDNLDIERIFDEFYTMDISRTKQNTGLGLAIVKEFCEMLGWAIYALKQDKKLKIILRFKSK